jgi:outer membrane protein assembly factor BamB
MAGLCPMHRGQSPVVGAQSSAKAAGFTNGVWLSGAVRGSPVIAADGTIYAGSTLRFSAINSTGTTKWSVAPGIGTGASPAIGLDGTVYIPTAGSASVVKALSPTNGSPKWSFSLGGTVSSGPALSADGATVYVASQNGKLVALSTANGQRKWTFTKGPMWTSPAIGADGTVYIGADDGLHAVDPATGVARWSRSFGTGGFVRSSPVVAADGTIYVGTDLKRLEATNPDGTPRFSFTGPGIGIVRSTAALAPDGTVYFGTEDNKVYAVNANGAGKWTFTTGGCVDASPAVGADGRQEPVRAQAGRHEALQFRNGKLRAWGRGHRAQGHGLLRIGRPEALGSRARPLFDHGHDLQCRGRRLQRRRRRWLSIGSHRMRHRHEHLLGTANLLPRSRDRYLCAGGPDITPPGRARSGWALAVRRGHRHDSSGFFGVGEHRARHQRDMGA